MEGPSSDGLTTGGTQGRTPGGPSEVDRLLELTHLLVEAEFGRQPAVGELGLRRPSLSDPAAIPLGRLWSASVAAAARLAAHRGDLEACRVTVELLRPFADECVVMAPATPVGPVGWFIAPALQKLGESDTALSVNRRAEAVSRRLRSPYWITTCLLQRVLVFDTVDSLDAAVALAEARHLAARAGRVELVATIGQLLDQLPRGRRSPAAAFHRDGTGPARLHALPAEDRHLFTLVADGLTNREIASVLSYSVPTVERRLTRLYRTLGVRNRAHLVSVFRGGCLGVSSWM